MKKKNYVSYCRRADLMSKEFVAKAKTLMKLAPLFWNM